MPIYFVYKFCIKKLGLFYIGVTNDLDRRHAQHWSKINVIVNNLRFKRGLKSRGHPGYLFAATQIIKGKRFLQIENCFKRNMVVMKVLDIKDTPREAGELEAYYLDKFKDDPKCFNHQNKSNYPSTSKRVPVPAKRVC